MEPEGENRPGGFNWVNLLVLVAFLAIVGVVLIALLTPVIQDGYPRHGRNTVCQNNLRQISTALLSYENSHVQFPGYANVLMTNDGKPYVDPDTGKTSAVSFVVPILRLLDRPDLESVWRVRAGARTNENANAPYVVKPKVRLDVLQCRSNPPTSPESLSNSYVLNCGMKDCIGSPTMPRDWPENGVFFDLFTGDPRLTGSKTTGIEMVQMSNAYIAKADGLQNTILMSENVDAGDWTDTDEARIGMLWSPKGTIDKTKNPPHQVPLDDNMRINHGTGESERPGTKVDAAVFARPSSYHLGGVNMAFCDGRVQFVSDQIDYYVYCLLMSTNGQRVREPGSNTLVPGFGVEVNDDWILR